MLKKEHLFVDFSKNSRTSQNEKNPKHSFVDIRCRYKCEKKF